jgi:hypothetical protein
MSGVYIKGIEMPKSCSVCPMLEGDRMDGLCHAASKWLDDAEHWTWYVYPDGDMDDSKPCNCPLVLVPPHGRLGDLDALKERVTKRLYASNHGSMAEAYFAALIDLIDTAPTIIPAEEGE